MELLAIVSVGAVVGALLGSKRSCKDGGCPLTANPRRGALWGAFLALSLALTQGLGCGGEYSESTSVTDLSSASQFEELVSQEDGTAVVAFYSPSCSACQQYKPEFNAMAQTHSDDATFAAVDATRLKDVAQTHNVNRVPTTLIFHNGTEGDRFLGIMPEDRMAKVLGELQAQ